MDSMSAFRASWKVRLVAFGSASWSPRPCLESRSLSPMIFVSFMSAAHYCLRSPHFCWLHRREKIGSPLFCFFSHRRSCSRSLSCRKHLFFGRRFCCGWRLSCGCYSGSDSPELSQSLAAMILIAVSAWYCVFYIPVQMQRALTHVGNGAAPPFTLQPISQSPVPIRSTPGKILVLDFFATWCSPCIAELPELERVRADLQTSRDIEFVLVGTNSGGDTPERVRAFAQRRQISLPVAFDPDRKTMRAFGLSGFPNLVVIDRTGRVRLTHTGYNSSETSFRRDLTQLLQSL